MSSRILITGASGFVGSALVPALQAEGAQIVRLARGTSIGSAPDEKQIFWDPAQPISPDALSGFDALIHLAGESVLGRWTAAKKALIRDSRIPTTRNLAQALSQAQNKPKVFLSASAIGYYGNRANEVLNEDSASGSGFAAELSREWEAAALPATEAGIRTVQMRMGIILGKNGGALQTMLPPFKIGIGGKLGSGRQWMSWVDVQDVVGAIQHILKTDQVRGPVNVVAPAPVTNTEFTKTLASVLSRPAIFPLPAFAARLVFGQMADELLLASQRVQPARLLSSGYIFRFPQLRTSLQRILKG
jgi:uncharacterized protein